MLPGLNSVTSHQSTLPGVREDTLWTQDAKERIVSLQNSNFNHCCLQNESPICRHVCVFSLIQLPPCSVLSRFDLGRYCYVPYIPIFGKEDDVLHNIYPMLGELSHGYGSVELNLELPHAQSCQLKCYPKLVHYLKARNIGVDLPMTLKGYKSHVGALEEMLIKFNADSGRHLCGFRFELAISGTTLSLMQCNDTVIDYQMNEEGVPERTIVMKKLTVDEYIHNLTNALTEAKVEGLFHGRISSSPPAVQKYLIAAVMNTAGYCSTKWVGYCRTKEQKKFEEVQVEQDEDAWGDIIKSILKKVYTIRSAHNSQFMCAVNATGGRTKSFPSHVGLARHFFDEYGEHWYRYVKLINDEGEPQQFWKKGTPSVAPDPNLEGSYNIIGCLTYNGQIYCVLGALHNGSCLYHLFSSMIWDLKGEDTPST